MAVPVLQVFHEGVQQRLPLPGAVVHAFLDASFADPVAADLGVGDRTGRHPDRPLLGFRRGPRLEICVEGADGPKNGVEVALPFAVDADCDPLAPPLVDLAVDVSATWYWWKCTEWPSVADQVTGKPTPGPKYAARTQARCETVLRSLYDFHREEGAGPVLNLFLLDRGRRSGRANAGHLPPPPAALCPPRTRPRTRDGQRTLASVMSELIFISAELRTVRRRRRRETC
ncbi:hypothetical protein [Streptomyces sp. GbtcB6]|uniref:hypothetical protein n=1 Tax=Streptomyces sp. GbtcB6 TaxID=2824751 RepID=UPI0020C6B5DF|nr:hypothetical protein [Streptomyces sp. GbtcB6]